MNESNYELPQNRERIFFVCFRKDLKIREFGFPRPLGKPCSIDQILEPSPKGVKVVCRPDTYFTKKDFKPDVDLSGQIMLPNRPIQIGYVNKGGQGERIYSTYGHAVTLSAYGGGVGSKTGLYLVDGVIRKLSPRECARVQGFPESFIIPNLSTQAYKQFGNSVAVNVVKAIAEQIVFSLQSSKLHSQAPKMASHQSGN